MKTSMVNSAILLAPLAAGNLVWPSEWDELEDIYTMMDGYNRRGFTDAVNPCNFGSNVPGRHNAAEWIRTGFHDMATHDAEAGTGGLDASIFFEVDRPENAGSAFDNSFGHFSGYHNVRVSAADLVALGVVVATGACGGPSVPLRGGRKDATQAGPAGVPEPSTDLDSTVATFQKAGFTEEDMIAMVACGHALGGVHSADFPEIVEIPADPDNDTSVPFQEDVSQFHNGVVTEFLANSTKNPLVAGANDTTNSDKRIFESDGRKTMQRLAEGDNFNTMCADIFARMIDTVPRGVELTEVIQPYDVKPYIKDLSVNDDGDIHFQGDIRLRTTDGTRDPEDIAVEIRYTGRDSSDCKKTTIPTQRFTFQGGGSFGIHGENFVTYTFDAVVKGESGIGNFMIYETVISTNHTTIHDNQGTGGYPIQDTILYQFPQSCLGPYSDDAAAPLGVVAMVREDAAVESLRLDAVDKVAREGVVVPELRVKSVDFVEATGQKKKKGWVEYRAETTIKETTTFDIVAKGGDDITVPFLSTAPLNTYC